MRPNRSHSSQGSALLLVLWSLLLLSMSVFGVVEITQASVAHAAHLASEAQARALALSGLAVALDPDILTGNSLLQRKEESGGTWDVALQSEAARLNLNFVLMNGHREILTRLFESWNVEPGDAVRATDCLFDWITPPDAKPSPNGAKQPDYQRAQLTHFPTGKPFATLDEVSEVMGMDAVAKANPNWQDAFTLLSHGPLNVNEAPPELLAAVFNLPLSQAATFTKKRNGEDGVVGTADDVPVPDMAHLKTQLGLGNDAVKALGPQVTFDDQVRRIVSHGEANGVQVTISAVIQLKSSPPAYLLWNER